MLSPSLRLLLLLTLHADKRTIVKSLCACVSGGSLTPKRPSPGAAGALIRVTEPGDTSMGPLIVLRAAAGLRLC